MGGGKAFVSKGFLHKGTQLAIKVSHTRLYHHARITPRRGAVRRTHAVHHYLLCAARRRHHETTGTHAETIYATTVHLRYKAVFGSGQPAAAPALLVIKDLVDEMGRMLQAHADGYVFGFEGGWGTAKHAVDIAGGMARGQYHRAFKGTAVAALHAAHLALLHDELLNAGLEMHLTAAVDDAPPHGLDDAGQAVGADVGVRVLEDIGRRSMLAEHAEDFLHIAPLL